MLISAAVYAGSTGNLNIGLVIAAAAGAAILGDNVGYWAGRRWGMPLLLRYGHLIALDHGRLKLGQYLFRQHGGKIVFFGRFTAMLRAYAAVLAGVNRWMRAASSPSTPWAASSGPPAWASAPTIADAQIEHIVGPVGLTLLALVVFGGLALWLFVRRHEARLLNEAELAIPGPLA